MSGSPLPFNSGMSSPFSSAAPAPSNTPNSAVIGSNATTPIPPPSSTSPAPGNPPPPGQFVGENFQPTVRVMRL